MKKFSALLLVGVMAISTLTACGSATSTPASVSVESITEADTATSPEPEVSTSTEASTPTTPDDSVPPEEGMIRSQLTNEWVKEEVAKTRPLTIMIPNNASALPQYNISNADVIYECQVEYEITRLMAVMEDWSSYERIGNVRSMRDYYVYWAFEWDPLMVHYGNPWYANNVLSRSTVSNINGTVDSGNVAFYRVTNEGRIHEQTAYVSGEGVIKRAKQLGYTLEHTDIYEDGHFSFAPISNPNTLEDISGAKTAKMVNLEDAYPIDYPYFEYNEEDGLYYRYQYDAAHIDGANNEQLKFKNIIIQYTYYQPQADNANYLAYQCIDNTRDGYFITNGKAIHITWKKSGDYKPTKYYDDNGNEVLFNQGKTMICIVQDGDNVEIN